MAGGVDARVDMEAALEKTGVLPHVFHSGSQKEPPAGWQLEVWDHSWAPVDQMFHMERLEEIRCIGQLFTSPEVPSRRISFWRVT
jgi:hypothetical protein